MSRPAPKARIRFPRAARVKPALDALLDLESKAAQLKADPLGLVHRYADPKDQEIVGLIAACVAYGRVSLFRPRLSALLDKLGPSPAEWLAQRSPEEVLERCQDFKYRMTGAAEVAALLYGAAQAQKRHGSLGNVAKTGFSENQGDMKATLNHFVEEIWAFDPSPFIGSSQRSRRMKHLLSAPKGQSAGKRLNLYFRWMIRAPDGADLGLWELPPSALVIPLDTHVHRISGFLGLTRREDLSWKTAEEITARLRILDPEDPVKYDFALAHLGISGDCPSKAELRVCSSCPLLPVCRVWDRKRHLLPAESENARPGGL